MNRTRHVSVLGLGFGDCGKGHFVDALARRWQAHTVVRFSGGAQAGHNVVVRATDGTVRHHTFSQFGSGTFVAGTRTLLLDPMIVHPTALLVEADTLQRRGVDDALIRTTIDGRCRVTTPFHQAAGRLRELLRGNAAHGTCGIGVGETVHHGLEHPDEIFRYEDLRPERRRAALEKLEAIRVTLSAELVPQCPPAPAGAMAEERRVLEDETLAARWLGIAGAVARQCPPAGDDEITRIFNQPGCIIHEGAQGILLDEWHGFHPHTTWSSITTAALETVLARFGPAPVVEHLGAMRCYATRHGAGPLPTQDPALDQFLPEPHNGGDGWQGTFRRGHPDGVLLHHALRSVGPLQGLLVGHLDGFRNGASLKWCGSYGLPGSTVSINRLPEGAPRDLAHQETLTRLLGMAVPRYEAKKLQRAESFLSRLSAEDVPPILATSWGPDTGDVLFR